MEGKRILDGGWGVGGGEASGTENVGSPSEVRQQRERGQRDQREGRSAPGSKPPPAAGKGWWDTGRSGNKSCIQVPRQKSPAAPRSLCTSHASTRRGVLCPGSECAPHNETEFEAAEDPRFQICVPGPRPTGPGCSGLLPPPCSWAPPRQSPSWGERSRGARLREGREGPSMRANAQRRRDTRSPPPQSRWVGRGLDMLWPGTDVPKHLQPLGSLGQLGTHTEAQALRPRGPREGEATHLPS